MATNRQLVNGNLKLAEQQQSLQFVEQMTFAQVIAYSKTSRNNAAGTANEAVLDDVPIGQQPPPIQLQAAKDEAEAAKITSDQIAAHRTIVFHSVVSVTGKDTIVIGFR